MEEKEPKVRVPIYLRLLVGWLTAVVLANGIRFINSLLMLTAALSVEDMEPGGLRSFFNSLLDFETIQPHHYAVFISTILLSGSLLVLCMFFARHKRWARVALKAGLTVDVCVFVAFVLYYRAVHYQVKAVDSFYYSLVYIIAIAIPTIILLGHPLLVAAWKVQKIVPRRSSGKDQS